MAKYNLLCSHDHPFEGWFDSEKAYLDQKKSRLLICPMCDDPIIRRAVMSPNLKSKTTKRTVKEKSNKVFFNSRQALKNLNNWVSHNCENVGTKFAKEARKAHKGERDDHIYGTATDKEIDKLYKDGIPAIKIPKVKDN
ncbi:uncharacterized protein METZ01_LOCUS142206 [marine metagenome]|uniref:DUF1178 domain-containing protein n=1 Tax=marine metagenome TaxID=408172 RepID=A0A381ZKJ5_9ZZZZ|tara:strand:- start:50842 stop:51258 length:417 start_codon:yes stop_codon:yes gene_type:complete